METKKKIESFFKRNRYFFEEQWEKEKKMKELRNYRFQDYIIMIYYGISYKTCNHELIIDWIESGFFCKQHTRKLNGFVRYTYTLEEFFESGIAKLN